ncbi:hypothetical protein BCR36DRAFT_371197 [Piromyces finnis]|uniref:Uncharacterized protein n=1 Tax=Piromyces finnis TaxID=1754191 RepID=A0A1Y1V7Q2_9FUNG|nr:hypothetical protein BCR36DRAFT_371197 [Piromyces finnis]|eukprot:ORX48708.1 hypothetical protein BCR36DRAFT_371197 [Piromyces finnis]
MLKDIKIARGSISSNFSLNEPMLEELFVHLERETEVKRNLENIKNKLTVFIWLLILMLIEGYLSILYFFLPITIPNYGIIRTIKIMIHAGISHDALQYNISILKLLHPKTKIIPRLVGKIICICFYGYMLKKDYHKNL